MKVGPDCLDLLHYYEKLVLKAYPDPASPLALAIRMGLPTVGKSGAPWTIGYGDTGADVVEGLVITEAEADARLAKRLAREFIPGVAALLLRQPTQRQFDALVSFALNVGLGNLRSSTLLKCFNRGETVAAAAQFPLWNKAQGQVMLGLRRRRAAEQALFRGMTGTQAIAIGAAIN